MVARNGAKAEGVGPGLEAGCARRVSAVDSPMIWAYAFGLNIEAAKRSTSGDEVMNLVEEIRQAWGWIGIRPAEVVGENNFGNLIVKDEDGCYWRICPKDLACAVIATDRAELDALANDQDFLRDWYMAPLVEWAEETLGPLTEGRKYCLKIPSVLGGVFAPDNLATISQSELVRASGDLARQIQDLPDGARIQLRLKGDEGGRD